MNGKHILIGTPSFLNNNSNEDCGIVGGQTYTLSLYFNHVKAGRYIGYADVAYFRSWIDTTVSANGGATYCPGEYSKA